MGRRRVEERKGDKDRRMAVERDWRQIQRWKGEEIRGDVIRGDETK